MWWLKFSILWLIQTSLNLWMAVSIPLWTWTSSQTSSLTMMLLFVISFSRPECPVCSYRRVSLQIIWVLMGWDMQDILGYVKKISFSLVWEISKTSFFYPILHKLISFHYLEISTLDISGFKETYLCWISFTISLLDMSELIEKYLWMDQKISFDLFKDIQQGYLTVCYRHIHWHAYPTRSVDQISWQDIARIS